MKCKNCGQEILSNNICENCGYQNNILNNNYYNKIRDESSVLAGILGFFIPIIGVTLYFLLRRTKPVLAKSFKIGVIVNLSICTSFVVFYLSIIPFLFLNIKS